MHTCVFVCMCKCLCTCVCVRVCARMYVVRAHVCVHVTGVILLLNRNCPLFRGKILLSWSCRDHRTCLLCIMYCVPYSESPLKEAFIQRNP